MIPLIAANSESTTCSDADIAAAAFAYAEAFFARAEKGGDK